MNGVIEKMNKYVACTECEGFGWITNLDDNPCCSILCNNCNGAGVVLEQATKADCLRIMSDKQLAEHLVEIGWDCHLCSEHERLDNEPLLRCEKCDEQCAKHCLEWLQKPAE